MATATQSGMTSGTHQRRKPGMTSWRPFTRRDEWAIAFAIALAVMLAGGGVMLWTVYSKSRLPSLTNPRRRARCVRLHGRRSGSTGQARLELTHWSVTLSQQERSPAQSVDSSAR